MHDFRSQNNGTSAYGGVALYFGSCAAVTGCGIVAYAAFWRTKAAARVGVSTVIPFHNVCVLDRINHLDATYLL